MPQRNPLQDLNLLANTEVAASPIDTFIGPTDRQRVGEPISDSENNLLRLSDAIEGFKEPLMQKAYLDRKKQVEDDTAMGAAEFDKNRLSWNEYVKKNPGALGASPWFTRAYQRAQLRQTSSTYSMFLRQAYDNDQTGIRSTDDPTAMSEWIGKQQAQFRQNNLQGFSPLDIMQVYDPLSTQANAAMMSAHVAQRVQAHEQAGIETAGSEVNSILDAADANNNFNALSDQELDALGRRLNQTFDGQDGFVRNGMPGTMANQILTNSIIQKAITSRNFGVLRLLDHIGSGGVKKDAQGNPVMGEDGQPVYNAKLGSTAYAKDKRQAAQMAIMDVFMKDQRYNAQLEDDFVQGDATTRLQRAQALQAHQKQVWERSDAEYDQQRKNWEKKNAADAIQSQVEAEKKVLMTGVRAWSMNDPRVQASLNRLINLDPDAARTMEDYLNTRTATQGRFVETDLGRKTFNQLRMGMSTNPEEFNSSAIFKAGNDGLISSGQVDQLYGDWERLRANNDNPFLRHPVYLNTLETVAKAINKDPNFAASGEGAMQAAQAQYEVRTHAQAWLADHPNATQSQFLDFINGSLRPTILKWNKDMWEDAKAAQAKREVESKPRTETTPQSTINKLTLGLAGTPEQTKVIPPKPQDERLGDVPIDAQALKTALPPEATKELKQMQQRIVNGPAPALNDVEALVRKHFEPIFVNRPKSELNKAVNDTVAGMMLGAKKEKPAEKEGPVQVAKNGGQIEGRPLTWKDMSVLLPEASRNELRSMIARINDGGKTVKPPTEEQVTDLVRQHYAPHFAKRPPSELADAINETVATMMHKQTKKKDKK